jgi:putative endonuclease
MKPKQFFCYITTNPTKTVLYVGASNDLPQRLTEHYLNRGLTSTFAGRYNCYNLVYFETYLKPGEALAREIQLKGWTRKKKEQLVESENPDWKFLNNDIMDWPPPPDAVRRKK